MEGQRKRTVQAALMMLAALAPIAWAAETMEPGQAPSATPTVGTALDASPPLTVPNASPQMPSGAPGWFSSGTTSSGANNMPSRYLLQAYDLRGEQVAEVVDGKYLLKLRLGDRLPSGKVVVRITQTRVELANQPPRGRQAPRVTETIWRIAPGADGSGNAVVRGTFN